MRCYLRDHPRRCGENRLASGQKQQFGGSPPQVRGKRQILCVTVGRKGITPAGAGKTQALRRPKSSVPDHPRRCGENCLCRFLCVRNTGSPPQVRGKPKGCANFEDADRITPAGAGKTILRICGTTTVNGSPPQVRGKHIRRKNDACTGRITPAGARKTELDIIIAVAVEDHPRRCGENSLR